MPDESKQKPTFEDLVRDFGYDKMEFFSEMVRPDQHEERGEDSNVPTPTSRPDLASLTPDERNVIDYIESQDGRKLTQQEINLALEQWRSM
jgi:hypothetical protein